MEIFYEVAISPSHGGFGMYDTGEHNYSPQNAWVSLSDLENELFAKGLDFLPIDEAISASEYQAAGVEDIRGRIYGGDPKHLYAGLSDYEGSGVYYFGIEAAEVSDDYFEE